MAAHDALLTLVLIVLTIMVLMWGGGLYMQKKSSVIAIEVGYVAAMAVVMAVCQGII